MYGCSLQLGSHITYDQENERNQIKNKDDELLTQNSIDKKQY
jgi:hypothetical protein